MTISAYSGGWNSISKLHAWDGAAWCQIKEGWVFDGAIWRKIFEDITKQAELVVSNSVYGTGAWRQITNIGSDIYGLCSGGVYKYNGSLSHISTSGGWALATFNSKIYWTGGNPWPILFAYAGSGSVYTIASPTDYDPADTGTDIWVAANASPGALYISYRKRFYPYTNTIFSMNTSETLSAIGSSGTMCRRMARYSTGIMTKYTDNPYTHETYVPTSWITISKPIINNYCWHGTISNVYCSDYTDLFVYNGSTWDQVCEGAIYIMGGDSDLYTCNTGVNPNKIYKLVGSALIEIGTLHAGAEVLCLKVVGSYLYIGASDGLYRLTI